MNNLLAIDFYKIFRTKFFYVIGAVLSLLTAFSSAAVSISCISFYEEQIAKSGGTIINNFAGSYFGNAWNIVFSNLANVGLLASLMSILFVCSEFSFETIKNIASKGYKRAEIYLSKFLTSIVSLGIYFVLTFFVSFVTCVIVASGKVPNFFSFPSHMFLPLFFVLLFLIVEVSLAVMVAFLVKKSGQAIAAYIVPTMVVNVLLNIVDTNIFANMFHSEFRLSNYVYTSCFSEIMGGDLNSLIPSNNITRYSFVALGFLLLAIFIGVYYFKKKDI